MCSTVKIKLVARVPAVVLSLAACATHSNAVSSVETLQTLPEGKWQRLNSNRFDGVWWAFDQALRPSPGDVLGNPGADIRAWS